MRAELAAMRTAVQALAENVAALAANNAAQERAGVEQPASVITDEVLIIETSDASVDEEGGPLRTTQD